MSHEPECAFTGDILPGDSCGTCNLIRIGYKRGRRHAANDLQASITEHWWLWERFDRLSFNQWRKRVVAAIRGGEQAVRPKMAVAPKVDTPEPTELNNSTSPIII